MNVIVSVTEYNWTRTCRCTMFVLCCYGDITSEHKINKTPTHSYCGTVTVVIIGQVHFSVIKCVYGFRNNGMKIL